MAKILDADLLARFEARCRQAGALYLDELEPGASEDDFAAAEQRLGFALPEEARTWYRWHNGSAGHYVTHWRTLVALSENVEETRVLQEFDQQWPANWLRTMDEQPFLALDCGGSPSSPVPVWHYMHGFSFPTRPVFESIGNMVSYWIELIDGEVMQWSVERGWFVNEPTSPDVREMLGGIP